MFVRSGSKPRSGGSFPAIYNELVISGVDTVEHLTVFRNQAGRHEEDFYTRHKSDEHSKFANSSLSTRVDGHYQTSTGAGISSISLALPALIVSSVCETAALTVRLT